MTTGAYIASAIVGWRPNSHGPFQVSRHSRQIVVMRSMSACAADQMAMRRPSVRRFIGRDERSAEKPECISPAIERQRARAITWSFAALNSIEPPLQELGLLNLLWANEDWAIQRRPILESFVNQRLNDLSASLGNREYLEDRFTAADLLMTTVLRIPRQQPIVEQYGNLFAYKERCEARPAFQRALRAQMQDFERNAPPTA